MRVEVDPEHGPAWGEMLLCFCTAAAFFATGVIGPLFGGLPALAAIATWAITFLVGGFFVLAGGWRAAQIRAWARWLREHRAERDRIVRNGAPLGPDEAALLCGWEVRRAWPTLPAELGALIGRTRPGLRASMERDGVPRVRAIVVGPASWWRELPTAVPADLVEPEEIRRRPTGRFLLRRVFSAGGVPDLIARGLLALVLLAIVWRVALGMSWYGIYGVWGYALGATVAVLAAWWLAAAFGRSLLGSAIVAGPSFLERAGTFGATRWTAETTTLLVSRTRDGSGVLAALTTTEAPGAPRPITLRFFGLDDPGFQTLWRMWLHPLGVEHLTPGRRRETTQPAVRSR